MKIAVRLSLWLGIVSVVAVGVSFFALNDIGHGDGGPPEWWALRVSFAIILAFQLSALMTLWRVMRGEGPAGPG
jgi:hypothetical protein